MEKLVAKGTYNSALAKYDSLKSLDALMDDMSSKRAAGTCPSHVNFFAESGKLSLGDMNAIIASIKSCSCDTQTGCTGNSPACPGNQTRTCTSLTCDCDSDWDQTGYSCGCNGESECRCVNDGYTDGQCWTHQGYLECESDSGTYCSCDTESCTCNYVCTCDADEGCVCHNVCTCNVDAGCPCNVNSVCSCNSLFS